MKHIKPFNEDFRDLTREEIDNLCNNKFDIGNWTINSEGTIDADWADLSSALLKSYDKLPLKFGKINRGSFYCCNSSSLTSLEGSPHHVDGHYHSENQLLTSLEGGPSYVGGDYWCENNKLTTLLGAPKSVANFYCGMNKLTSFVGAPEIIKEDFTCRNNNITSFEGFPKSVRNFSCVGNPIYQLWKIFGPTCTYRDYIDTEKIELFNDFDPIRGSDLILDRLNDFLVTIGLSPVFYVRGYNNI